MYRTATVRAFLRLSSCSCSVIPDLKKMAIVRNDNTNDNFYLMDGMLILSSYHRNHGSWADERRNDLLITLPDCIAGLNLITV